MNKDARTEGGRFICLGWGSLIWNPRDLPLRGCWNSDGPKLPIEFARKSQNGRITLVVCEDAPAVSVLWAALDVDTLDEAKEALRKREGTIDPHIGFWSAGRCSAHGSVKAVAAWAEAQGHVGVVWTALPPKFPDVEGKPSREQVVGYLKSLHGDLRTEAEDYVRKAPRQIRTPYREAIEQELHWTPSGKPSGE